PTFASTGDAPGSGLPSRSLSSPKLTPFVAPNCVLIERPSIGAPPGSVSKSTTVSHAAPPAPELGPGPEPMVTASLVLDALLAPPPCPDDDAPLDELL